MTPRARQRKRQNCVRRLFYLIRGRSNVSVRRSATAKSLRRRMKYWRQVIRLSIRLRPKEAQSKSRHFIVPFKAFRLVKLNYLQLFYAFSPKKKSFREKVFPYSCLNCAVTPQEGRRRGEKNVQRGGGRGRKTSMNEERYEQILRFILNLPHLLRAILSRALSCVGGPEGYSLHFHYV